MIKNKDNNIGTIYLGNKPINKIYKGDNLVYQNKSNSFSVISADSSISWRLNNGSLRTNEITPDIENKIKITGNITSLSNMFNHYNINQNIDEITLDLRNTSNLTEITKFTYYNTVNVINIKNINTYNVTSLYQAFKFSTNLEYINGIDKFNTSNVINMSGLFERCDSLKQIDTSNFDTSNVKDMSSMFNQCKSLKYLDLQNFDTSKVTTMASMFNGCNELEYLDISSFDISKVTTLGMFLYMSKKLKTIKFGNKFNGLLVTNLYNTFLNCESLEEIDLRYFIGSNVTSMNTTFSGCKSLKYLDLSSFNPSTSTLTGTSNTFLNCNSLNHIKCKQAFKDLCMSKATNMKLPSQMQSGGTGIWEIVD